MALRPEASKIVNYLTALAAGKPTYEGLLTAFQNAGVQVKRENSCEAKVIDALVSGIETDGYVVVPDVKLELMVDVQPLDVDDAGYMRQDVGMMGFVTPLRPEIVKDGAQYVRHEPTSVYFQQRWTAKQPMHAVPTVARYEQVQREIKGYMSLKPVLQS